MVDQRGAGAAQSHRPVVHRPAVHRRGGGDGRYLLDHDLRHPAVRRRRPRGADLRRAGVRQPAQARTLRARCGMRCGRRSRCVPLFLALAFAGPLLLHPFGLDPHVEALALEYWKPRMARRVHRLDGLGGDGLLQRHLGGAFHDGRGRRHHRRQRHPQSALHVRARHGHEGLGVGRRTSRRSSAWRWRMVLFLRGDIGAASIARRLMWRPRWPVIRAQLMVGLPIGVMYGADVLGLALSQMMIAQTSATAPPRRRSSWRSPRWPTCRRSASRSPGTTLVGQSIGAGNREWANRLGNVVIAMCAALMAFVAVAAAGGRAVGVAVVRQQRRRQRRRRRRARA